MSNQSAIDILEQQALEQARADAEKLVGRDQVEDVVWLMSDRRGRRVMWGLLEKAGLFRQTFTGEALTSAFNEGKRAIGLSYMAVLNGPCREQYLLMLKEREEDGYRTQRRDANARRGTRGDEPAQ